MLSKLLILYRMVLLFQGIDAIKFCENVENDPDSAVAVGHSDAAADKIEVALAVVVEAKLLFPVAFANRPSSCSGR